MNLRTTPLLLAGLMIVGCSRGAESSGVGASGAGQSGNSTSDIREAGTDRSGSGGARTAVIPEQKPMTQPEQIEKVKESRMPDHVKRRMIAEIEKQHKGR